MSSAAVGMKERQAIMRRTVSVALDQAEGVMPILDERVKHAATVRHGGHFEQILPAIPESIPQRQPLPVGLTVDQDPFGAGVGRAQV